MKKLFERLNIGPDRREGKALATFSTDDLRFPEIGEVDRQIINWLARGDKTLGSLSERPGISKATVWRRLERAGMVRLSKGGRREIAVELTKRGRLYCEVLPGVVTAQPTPPGEGSREAP